jgi:5-methylcytosine-specific restriction endonuclease McrA
MLRNNNRKSHGTISEELRLQVLHRDAWRCQICGSLGQPEVHHLLFRSRGGQNTEQNLVTLCHGCHTALHIYHRDRK